MNELSVHIEKTPESSQMMSSQNDLNKLRLPISTQRINVPNSIKSTSLLTDLHDEDDTNSSKKSISSDNSSAQISPNNSENQNDDDDKQSSNEEIDNIANVVVHSSIMLPSNFSVVQQPANMVLSPLRSPVNTS